jgi:hypothetical protein
MGHAEDVGSTGSEERHPEPEVGTEPVRPDAEDGRIT